jgi:hypothetical protein
MNYIKTLVVTVLILVAVGVTAQKHYVKVWGGVGYANFLTNAENLTPWGGGGGLLGLGYEIALNRFLLSIGGELDFKTTFIRRDPFKIELDMIDTEGDPLVYTYDFSHDKYRENYNIGYVNVPLMFGAQFSNKMYFLLGGKFGMCMFGNAILKSHVKTSGKDPTLIDPFVNMPEHFFTDLDLKGSNPVSLDFTITASMEIGKIIYPMKKRSRIHYRIAAFADYGIKNINPEPAKDSRNIITIPVDDRNQADVLNVQMNSTFTSVLMKDRLINPLLVGAKFTVLFDLGEKEPCHCLPEYRSRWNRKRR